MKYSVVVPIYNMEKYLPEMLESAENQTFKDFNLVLVNDGSTDSCPEMCDDYAGRHPGTIVVHKPNGGLISARREGIRAADGDFILFCDADDRLKSKALERINDAQGESGADMVIFNADVFSAEGMTVFFEHILPEGTVEKKSDIYDHLFLDYSLNSMCLKATRRSCYDADRDYSEFYGCNVAEDMLQSVPILMNASKVYYLDESLYEYRTESGMTHKCNFNYYWSNRMINADVRERLKNEGITDLEQKAAFHILIAAYAGTTQMKWADKWDNTQLKKITGDIEFLRAWDTVWNSHYSNLFNSKQKLILKLLRKEDFTAIRLLLKVRGGK